MGGSTSKVTPRGVSAEGGYVSLQEGASDEEKAMIARASQIAFTSVGDVEQKVRKQLEEKVVAAAVAARPKILETSARARKETIDMSTATLGLTLYILLAGRKTATLNVSGRVSPKDVWLIAAVVYLRHWGLAKINIVAPPLADAATNQKWLRSLKRKIANRDVEDSVFAELAHAVADQFGIKKVEGADDVRLQILPPLVGGNKNWAWIWRVSRLEHTIDNAPLATMDVLYVDPVAKTSTVTKISGVPTEGFTFYDPPLTADVLVGVAQDSTPRFSLATIAASGKLIHQTDTSKTYLVGNECVRVFTAEGTSWSKDPRILNELFMWQFMVWLQKEQDTRSLYFQESWVVKILKMFVTASNPTSDSFWVTTPPYQMHLGRWVELEDEAGDNLGSERRKIVNLAIANKIVLALHVLSENNLDHSAICPENILLAFTGEIDYQSDAFLRTLTISFTDFAATHLSFRNDEFIKYFEKYFPWVVMENRSRTLYGGVSTGKRGYASPECFMNMPLEYLFSSNVFSFGVIIYHLLAPPRALPPPKLDTLEDYMDFIGYGDIKRVFDVMVEYALGTIIRSKYSTAPQYTTDAGKEFFTAKSTAALETCQAWLQLIKKKSETNPRFPRLRAPKFLLHLEGTPAGTTAFFGCMLTPNFNRRPTTDDMVEIFADLITENAGKTARNEPVVGLGDLTFEHANKLYMNTADNEHHRPIDDTEPFSNNKPITEEEYRARLQKQADISHDLHEPGPKRLKLKEDSDSESDSDSGEDSDSDDEDDDDDDDTSVQRRLHNEAEDEEGGDDE
jgi:serine/threonine protein kinase